MNEIGIIHLNWWVFIGIVGFIAFFFGLGMLLGHLDNKYEARKKIDNEDPYP